MDRLRRFVPLALVLFVGLVFRVLLWNKLPRTGLISDEGEYLAAASWLAEGRNFSWYTGYLWTRAPVYPLFVAAHLWLFAGRVELVYLTQIALSLINVALVYALAIRITNERHVAVFAALLMALYLPFATYTQVLLSETLYLTLLLGGFVALAVTSEHARFRYWPLVVAGVLFGLAALTRSLTLGFAPLIMLWLLAKGWTANKQHRIVRQAFPAALFTFAFCCVVLPWTVYNSTRLYGGLVVVDTTGGYNLALGARTAYDGTRTDAPTRNLALILLNQLPEPARSVYLTTPLALGGSCLAAKDDAALSDALSRAPVAQAELQRLLSAEGTCLIRERPLAFVQKSAGEFLDFFQINYSGDERFTDGFALGRLPTWYTLALFALDDTLYVLVLPLSALGFALYWRAHGARSWHERIGSVVFVIGLWFLFNSAVAPVLFAINRFRLPLLPFAFVFAAYALVTLPRINRGWFVSRGGVAAAVVAIALFLMAATPYAYFEPRPGGRDARWASYFGPYPSSVDNTAKALAARSDFVQQEAMRLALRAGYSAQAQALRPAGIRLSRVGRTVVATNTVLVDALSEAAAGQAERGLALLPDDTRIAQAKDVEAAVVRGDMLRTLGQTQEANEQLTASFVDDANPVEWAWDWLDPAPTQRINMGGNLDVGYVRGCYLGESIRDFDDANYRWCTNNAQIRFPQAGTGAPQTLILRADGRGWQGRAEAVPPVRVVLGETEVGSFTPSMSGSKEFRVALPPTPQGADIVLTLRTATFIPAADDYNRQQGPLVGQVRRLGVRLDWLELQ